MNESNDCTLNTLGNFGLVLECNKYTVWVELRGSLTGNTWRMTSRNSWYILY